MNSQTSHFLGFDQLALALGVSVKKLRADLDVSSGEIRLGGTVPPIQSMKIGHLRVVSKVALDRWLAAVGAISEEKTQTIPVPEVEKPILRRGRPRENAKDAFGDRA